MKYLRSSFIIVILFSGSLFSQALFQFSEPVLVDSSTDYTLPLDSYGATYPSLKKVCESDNYLLVVTNILRSDLMGLQRLDKSGNLIDSIPVVHRPVEDVIEYFKTGRFFDVTWTGEYFYIFETKDDWLFYTRFTEDLRPVDLTPQQYIRIPHVVHISGERVWRLWDDSYPNSRVELFILPNETPELENIYIPRIDFHISLLDQNGLYFITRDNTNKCYHSLFLSLDGTIRKSDTVFVNDSLINYHSLPNLRLFATSGDTVSAVCFDRSSIESKFIYFFQFDSLGTALSDSVIFVDTPIDSTNVPFLDFYNTSNGKIYGFGKQTHNFEYYYYSIEFDPGTNTVTFADTVDNEFLTPDYDYLSMKFINDSIYFFMEEDNNITFAKANNDNQFDIQDEKKLFYNGINSHMPSILLEDTILTLVDVSFQDSTSNLNSYQYSVSNGFFKLNQESIPFDEKIVRPWLYQFENDRGLLWHKDIAGPGSDSMNFTILSGSYPVQIDIDNKYQLPGFYGSYIPYSYFQSFPFKQNIVAKDTLYYLNMVSVLTEGPYGGDASTTYLLSLNRNISHVVDTLTTYKSSGVPVMLESDSSFSFLKPSSYCITYDPFYGYCDYSRYIVQSFQYDNNQLTTPSLISSPAFESNLCHPDIFLNNIENNAYIFQRCLNDLSIYHPELDSLEFVLDLGPYMHGGYLDASSGYIEGKATPIQTKDFYVIVINGHHKQFHKIVAFDHSWNFVDSTKIPTMGVPSLFSEIVYDELNDQLIYAYASWLPSPYLSNRVILQKVNFDLSTSIIDDKIIPEEFTLYQNYPNPFNLETTIQFNLRQISDIDLIVYNLLGQEVIRISRDDLPAGEHYLKWDGKNSSGQIVSSGIYFYKLKTDTEEKSRKMILLK
ncbi:MAG: T9SS C-terminal target domain-containing protein [Calditrichaeota bacterium]|nr:MAG: T9SS C-terminal target domain-containing protein [Calditrichota bacterium]